MILVSAFSCGRRQKTSSTKKAAKKRTRRKLCKFFENKERRWVGDMANTLELTINAKDNASKKMKALKAVGGGVGLAFKALSAAATASVGALMTATLQAAKAGDKFDKMSQRVGASAETLSQLEFAARQSGSSIQTVENGLRILNKGMADAEQGTGLAKDAFNALGISVTDADGNLRANIDVLKEASTKLSSLDNETQKASLAGKIFGERYGTQLLPLLNQGGEGIEGLMKRADELGSTVSTVGAKDGADFTDAMDEAQTTISNLSRTIGQELVPVFTPLLENFANAVSDTIDWVEESEKLKGAIFGLKNLFGAGVTEAKVFSDTLKNMATKDIGDHLKGIARRIKEINDQRVRGGAFRTVAHGKEMEELKKRQEGYKAEFDERQAQINKDKEAEKIRAAARKKRREARKAEREEVRAEKKTEREEEAEEEQEEEELKISWSEQMELDANKLGMERKIENHKKQLEIDKKATAKKQQIIMNDAKFRQGVAGQLAGVAEAFGGKNTAAFKGFASAQAFMATYLGATKALGELGPIAGPIQAAIITAMGLANVAKIQGAKFHTGGLVAGNGEVPAVLEAGEFVIRKEAVSSLGEDNLRAINEGQGGDVSVVNFFDTDSLDEYLGSYKGQQAIINAIGIS